MRLLKCITVFAAVFFICSVSPAQKVRFERVSLKDGLSQATVNCIYQDSSGFIWIGTNDGLNVYNGYDFTVFRNSAKDSTSISNNTITSIYEDARGNMWIGTGSGLNRLDRETMEFEIYHQWFEDPTGLSSNRIRCISEDKSGRLWIGTENGLNLFHPETKTFTKYFLNPEDSTSVSNNKITDFLLDSSGNFWVATDGGLNLYNPHTDNFRRFRHKFDDDNSLSSNKLTCLYEDRGGLIWIGTEVGLNKFNPEFEVFTRYLAEFEGRKGLSSNKIKDVIEDENGHVWVATGNGLNRLYGESEAITIYRQNRMFPNSIPNNYILSLLIDHSGLLWIGTQSGGIATVNFEIQQFQSYIDFFEGENSTEYSNVHSFVELNPDTILLGTGRGIVSFVKESGVFYSFEKDKSQVLSQINSAVRSLKFETDSTLWIGTTGQGVYHYNLHSEKLKQYLNKPEDQTSISNNDINDIVIDSNELVWIATNGGGVNMFNPQTEQFTTFRYDGSIPESLKDNNVLSLSDAGPQYLWIGTGNAGLYRMNKETGELQNFKYNPDASNGISDNTIQSMERGKGGVLWIGTGGGGLGKYDPVEREFTSYSDKDGLSNNVVLGIVEDGNGNVWLSTNNGITLFNQSTETFRNYNEQDILASNSFSIGSAYCDSNGDIYFGGLNGFEIFNYLGLSENSFIPPVYITGITTLRSTENGVSENERNNTTILIGDTLYLNYDHPGFTLEFAALNFKQTEKNQYAYKFGTANFNYIGNRRFATFANLDPGNYVFKVIASNNDGKWNQQGTSLHIIIQPAFWQTNWFRILAVLLLIFAIYIFYQIRMGNIHRQKVELEFMVKERTFEIARERDTNAVLLREIHHRVKNNLQIITSLLSLQSRFIDNKQAISIFDEVQNRIRSMSMIHQKMYQTKDLSTVNIKEYITDLSSNLINTYQLSQNIDLDIEVEVNKFKSDTLTPLGLIINELISNSLKYAFQEDKKGRIFVRLTKTSDKKFCLIIGDNGIGIPEEREFGKAETFGTELIVALTEQLNGTIERVKEIAGTVYRIDFYDIAD